MRKILRRFFADNDDETSRHRSQPSRRSSREESDLDNLAERINKMLWDRRAILSGNIHLVGLSKIREHVGAEWPRIAERAQDIAQKAIQRHCGQDDVSTRYDELSYLIIFSSLTVEQAQLRCVEIAEEIGRRLLGENFVADAAEVSTGVFETDGSLVFNAVNKQNLVSVLLGQTSAEANVNGGTEATEGDTAKNETHGAGAISDDVYPDFAAFEQDKTRAIASLRISYLPMWNVRHSAIINYFAAASAINMFGKEIGGGALREEFSNIISPSEFDTYVARTVLRDVAEHVAQGNRILMGWTVHFETLATRASRDEYIEICRHVPEPIRQLLVLEIEGLPSGIPGSRMLDVTGVLRPFCRNLFVRVPSDFRRFDVFDGCHLGGVGFSFAGVPANDAQRITVMNRFIDGASKAGLSGYIHGLDTRAQVLAAVDAGFDLVSGAAVAISSETLGKMRRFVINDLHQKEKLL